MTTSATVRSALATLLLLLAADLCRAATYYVSPSGSDSSGDGTLARPWRTASRAFGQGGGHTYVFRDGTYNYPGGTIDNPPSGTPASPTIVRAERDGRAVIDGSKSRTGIYIFTKGPSPKQHILIEGFRVQNCGENPAVQVSSQDGTPLSGQTNNITVRRVGARGDVMKSNNNVWEISRARDSLFEDVWGWGYGRYVMDVYGCTKVTVRRAVLRWDGWGIGADKPGDPKFGMGVYNTHQSLFENVMLIDAASTPLPGDKGGLYVPGNANGNTAPYMNSSNNSFLGLIVFNNIGHGVAVEGGSGGTNSNNRFENLISWGNSSYGITVARKAANTVFNHVTVGGNNYGAYFGNAEKRVSGTVITNALVTVNTKNGVMGGASPAYSNVYRNGKDYADGARPGTNTFSQNPMLEYLHRVEDNGSPSKKSGSDGGDRGANVTKRYMGGKLTGESLWPWPNQGRIKAEMCEQTTRGFCSAPSLTSHIMTTLGSKNPYGDAPAAGGDADGGAWSTSGLSIEGAKALDSGLVDVVFSGPVDRAGAEDPGNYKIDNGISVQGAVLDMDQRTVHLKAGPHKPGVTYTLKVANVGGAAAPGASGVEEVQYSYSGAPGDGDEPTDPLKPARKFLTPGKPGLDRLRFGGEAVDVAILDSAGHTILHKTKAGSENIAWDGKDEDGRTVEAGVYMSRIKGASGDTIFYPIAVIK